MRKKVLIIGPSSSVLIRQRAMILAEMDVEPHWYSQTHEKVEGITQYHRLTSMRIVGGLLECLHLLFLLCWIRPTYVHLFYAKNRWLNLVLALHPQLIVTVMGSDISAKTVPTDSIDFRLVKWLLQRAVAVTSKSSHMDMMLQRFNVPTGKVCRVTWGIDTQKFCLNLNSTPLRDKLGIPEGYKVFFSLRGCKPLYQHEMVLTAFGRFCREYPDAVLLVSTMGADESYLQSLKRQALKENTDDKVIFLPEICNDEMPVYFNLADAVISVPKSDGMPQSLYESMACGCFHILGDLPQYYEVIEAEESGLFVDLESDRALTAAFRWVVANDDHLKQLGPHIRNKILPLVDKRVQKNILNDIYKNLSSSQKEACVRND